MLRYALLLLVLIPIISLFPSCRTVAPVVAQEPLIVLISPNNGEVRNSGDVEVRIYLQNFIIVPDTGQANRAGEGHVIYYLDVSAPLEQGTPATTAAGTYAISTETAYTWRDVAPGKHVFTIQLVNNDDTPLDQPVAVRANVTLE